ncbi:MAG TPA: hypothetical protein PK581_01285 [Caldisericia bacterium]|jgi:hypothetical protein|nr:hypothetical protein [Caldisericia bacterium]
MKHKLCIAFEWFRWIGVIAVIQWAYFSFSQLENIFPVIVFLMTVLLAGLTGVEAVFLSHEANKITGYTPSAYQRQSGLFLLGLTFTAFIVFVFGWDLTASLAVLLNLILFLAFSSINHLFSAFYENNKSFRNLWVRGLGAWLLIGAIAPLLFRIWAAQ